jgi:CBS domain-containing protein
VHSVAEDASLTDVLRLMLDRDLKHVPVVRDERPLGMIARHDLLKMMLVGSEDAATDATSAPEG